MSTLPPAAQKRLQELQHAVALHKAGRLDEAATMYKALLKKDARDFDANMYLGMVLVQQQDFDAAVFRLQTATKLNPKSALAQCNLGVALVSLGRYADGAAAFAQALSIKPDFADAMIKLPHALYMAGQFDAALEAYNKILAIRPDPVLLNDKGCLLRDMGRYQEAVDTLNQALILRPNDPVALRNFGNALLKRGHELRKEKQFTSAIDHYARAAEYSDDRAEAFFYWGMLLYDLGRYDAAAQAYGQVLQFEPNNGAAYQGRAEALRRLDRAEEALADYALAVALLPDDLSLAISALHAEMKVCDWRHYPKAAELIARLREDEKAVLLPFPLVALPSTAEDQLLCAQRYVKRRLDTQAVAWGKPDYGRKKIRVAYVSADYHKHATLVLMAGMFEMHDKERFEVIAISLGRDDGSVLRQRVVAAVDEFIDASRMSDEAIVELLAQKQCDIIVDLKGFTMDSRPGLFAGRHAPVQVAYIGYPGTCALPNIDYFIGDAVTITPEIESYFSEKIVYLPHSYQVNDNNRFTPESVPTRSSQGLPEDVFVFCSFNNNYKFTPDVFAVWMNILRRTDGSVLWLLQDNQLMMDNLRAAAGAHGIDPARLIFADKAGLDDHIARLACADLFLDSLPCNAHTTASDALWAGLPVLTCPGNTFAGRVAASLLSAVEMPELIVPDLQAYEDLAVALAQDSVRYRQLRDKLAAKRGTAPLFDTLATTRAIERSYEDMMQRFRVGLPPDHIRVTSV